MWSGKVWYLSYFGGLACIWPFVNIYFHAHGLSDVQIGILAALRPWVSAPASFLWSSAADRFQAHQPILLFTIILSTLLRTCMAAAATFPAFLILAALSEFVAAPTGVIADAAVVASCHKDTEYGKTRLWGAIGWGGVSTLSGWAVARYGMGVGFAGYALLTLPCAFLAWPLAGALTAKQQQQQQQQRVSNRNKQTLGSPMSSLGRAQEEEQQQLLAGGQHSVVELVEAGGHGVTSSSVTGAYPLRSSAAKEQIRQIAAADGSSSSSRNAEPLFHPQRQDQHAHNHPQRILRTHASSAAPPCNPAPPASDCIGYHDQQQVLTRSREEPDVWSPHMSPHQPHSPVEPRAPPLGRGKEGSGSSAPQEGGVMVTADQQQQDQQQQTRQQDQEQPHQQEQQQQQRQPHHQQQQQEAAVAALPFSAKLALLLRKPEVLLFMWQAVVMGCGIGIIGEFLFLYLEQLGGSTLLMGLTLTVTCAAEVPAFQYQGRVLQVISEATMLHVVLWTYMLRMALYALLPYAGSPWAVLPVELLHGVTFACGWGAGTILSQRLAPPGLEATMQGIFQGLYFGVGQGLGGLIGGLLMEAGGGQLLFSAGAGLILCGWASGTMAEVGLAAWRQHGGCCAGTWWPLAGQPHGRHVEPGHVAAGAACGAQYTVLGPTHDGCEALGCKPEWP